MDFDYEILKGGHKICKRSHRRKQANAYSYTAYTDRKMHSPDALCIKEGHTYGLQTYWTYRYLR